MNHTAKLLVDFLICCENDFDLKVIMTNGFCTQRNYFDKKSRTVFIYVGNYD